MGSEVLSTRAKALLPEFRKRKPPNTTQCCTELRSQIIKITETRDGIGVQEALDSTENTAKPLGKRTQVDTGNKGKHHWALEAERSIKK
mmetsp:Transcript_1273/g.2191  ORF Transcript_1273/g.2191 Transcript_1273/m.2191 type:complete len:89 (+) Transcript_1273:787-1053(+)